MNTQWRRFFDRHGFAVLVVVSLQAICAICVGSVVSRMFHGVGGYEVVAGPLFASWLVCDVIAVHFALRDGSPGRIGRPGWLIWAPSLVGLLSALIFWSGQ